MAVKNTHVLDFKEFYAQEAGEGWAVPGSHAKIPLILIYGLACTLTFYVSSFILPSLSSTYDKQLTRQQKTDWDNRIVALGHAIIMTYRAVHYWTYITPFFKQTWGAIKVPGVLDPYEKDTLRLMTGYMIYDLAIELVTPASFDYPVLFHHIAGILSHWHTLITNDTPSGFYTMLVYIAEASTPILHIGWMLNIVGMADTVTFKILTLLLLIVFFMCRIMLSPLLAYAYLSPANRHLYDGRPGVFAFQLMIVIAFASLNFFWYYKLIALVIKKVKGIKTPHDEDSALEGPLETTNTSLDATKKED